MNVVRHLRRHARVTQQELAASAGTSQPTVAAYESGSKSPTLRTLHQFANALGYELFVSFQPPMTREDRRSLAFHEAIADHLRQDPTGHVDHARKNLVRLGKLHPHAGSLLSRWSRWLDLSMDDLISRMLDTDAAAREMRQVSPFSAVLSANERAKVLKEFRRDFRNEGRS